MRNCIWIAAGAVFLLSCGASAADSAGVQVQAVADHGDYEAYYDGAYGPFRDGYWGTDGFFYYTATGGRWQRDDFHHFRRGAAAGFSHVQGRGGPARPGMMNHP